MNVKRVTDTVTVEYSDHYVTIKRGEQDKFVLLKKEAHLLTLDLIQEGYDQEAP